jgi:hypothetical protein
MLKAGDVRSAGSYMIIVLFPAVFVSLQTPRAILRTLGAFNNDNAVRMS